MDWLDEIEARANAATPGTWRVNKMRSYEDHDECRLELPYDDLDMTKYEDAEFIAHARGDVPRLTAEVRALRADLARVTAERDAAVADVKRLLDAIDDPAGCPICKHYDDVIGECLSVECAPEWRGVCAYNTAPPHNYIGEEAIGGENTCQP